MIGVYFSACGFIIITIGVILVFKDKSTRRWKHTSGTIISSEYNSKIESNSDGGRYKTFMTTCKYEYSLQGSNKKIIGTKIFPFGGNSWTTNSEEQLNIYRKLHKGNRIQVYYHPIYKSKSCLIVGENYNLKLIVFIGLLIFIMGVGLFVQNFTEINMPEKLIESIIVVK
ncbi:DUF3592 domain-containing protein [Zobellia nedashkovskayae]|uniref:DUF3592 domain-containing protein n=1 Tax=Zobellia nedashkovskayae TaxID=2779510 RepID=UPI00188D84E7|nr:DUF3592 domain-containing protein [Zobellia nedashkovskayae]